MEILLSIVVASAVIFFGILISIGNERQRREIDTLNQAYKQWAIQDLHIKREQLVRNLHIDDPLSWFNQVINKVCCADLNIKLFKIVDEPKALIFTYGDEFNKIVFSPLSPIEMKRLRGGTQNKLTKFQASNPPFSIEAGTRIFELSVLNCGILFDLEFSIAWKGLTGRNLSPKDNIWMYYISR